MSPEGMIKQTPANLLLLHVVYSQLSAGQQLSHVYYTHTVLIFRGVVCAIGL